MDESGPPTPPDDLDEAGAQLWLDVLAVYELGPHELQLLLEACHLTNEIGALRSVIADQGAFTETAAGTPKSHPAVSQLAVARRLRQSALAALRLPDVAPTGPGTGPRPQHRAGPRGAYAAGTGVARKSYLPDHGAPPAAPHPDRVFVHTDGTPA